MILNWKIFISLFISTTIIFAIPTYFIFYANFDEKESNKFEWLSVMIPTPPILALQFLLGIPIIQKFLSYFFLENQHTPVPDESDPVAEPPVTQINGTINRYSVIKQLPLTSILTISFVLSGALYKQFEPYSTVSVFFFFLGLLCLLQAAAQQTRRGIVLWSDFIIFLVLWLILDKRWNYNIWFGPQAHAYNWWAIASSVIIVFGWLIFRNDSTFGYCLVPYPKSILFAFINLAIFGGIAIPIGLATGFLTYPPSKPITFMTVISSFCDIFFGVAIPEELFFRNIVQHHILDRLFYPDINEEEIEELTLRKCACKSFWKMYIRRWKSLLLASVFFSLMHWDEMDELLDRVLYCLFSFVAGIFYGTAFRMDGENIFAGALAHTLIDTVWNQVLK